MITLNLSCFIVVPHFGVATLHLSSDIKNATRYITPTTCGCRQTCCLWTDVYVMSVSKYRRPCIVLKRRCLRAISGTIRRILRCNCCCCRYRDASHPLFVRRMAVSGRVLYDGGKTNAENPRHKSYRRKHVQLFFFY